MKIYVVLFFVKLIGTLISNGREGFFVSVYGLNSISSLSIFLGLFISEKAFRIYSSIKLDLDIFLLIFHQFPKSTTVDIFDLSN